MSTNPIKIISITQYDREMGEIRFPNGFEEHLNKLVYEYDEASLTRYVELSLWNSMQESRAQSFAQQMRCFGWSEFAQTIEWDDPRLVAETPDEELQESIHPLTVDSDRIRLILKKNMVVGVVLNSTLGHYMSGEASYYLMKDKFILPYDKYIYSSTSDNNGAGYKERDWYRYLICLPYNHNLW